MQERDKLLTEQNKLLNQITDAIKQPFQEWYALVDKNKVNWFIYQFLLDCGYSCGIKDYQQHFSIPTGVEGVGLNIITAIVKQYSVTFIIGEFSSEMSLGTIRSLKNKENLLNQHRNI